MVGWQQCGRTTTNQTIQLRFTVCWGSHYAGVRHGRCARQHNNGTNTAAGFDYPAGVAVDKLVSFMWLTALLNTIRKLATRSGHEFGRR